MSLGYVCSAYRLWVDGRLVATVGRPGPSPQEEEPRYLPALVPIGEPPRVLNLALELSNFEHRCNGIWSGLALGPQSTLLRREQWNLALDTFFLGAALIMALYPIALHLMRPGDRRSLWFGLFCATIAFRLTVTGHELALRWFPRLPTGLEQRAEYFTGYAALPIFLFLLRSLYPPEFSSAVVTMASLVGAAGIASLLGTAYLASWVVLGYEVVLLGFVVVSVVGLIRAARRRREGAALFLVGVGGFFIALINDLLNHNHLECHAGHHPGSPALRGGAGQRAWRTSREEVPGSGPAHRSRARGGHGRCMGAEKQARARDDPSGAIPVG